MATGMTPAPGITVSGTDCDDTTTVADGRIVRQDRGAAPDGSATPPRVLIVTSFEIPGDYDGTSMLPIKIMRALRDRDVPVALAHFRARPPFGRLVEDRFEGVPLFRVPAPRWLDGLRAIGRRFPFDLVHAQHYGGATRSYPACRRDRIPMVYEIHSLLGDEVERDRLGRGLKFRGYLALERRVFRDAAAVVVLGEPVRDVVVAEKGVDPGRVHVIYPGIDLAEFAAPPMTGPIPGCSSDDETWMYIGNLEHPNQGVPRLIEALPHVRAVRPRAKLVLVGGPAEAGEAYRERLAASGHADGLVVLANQSPDRVVALARRADVLVHPRLACRENFSVQSKLAVYLAAGRPIVATDFGDYRRLLGETGAGLLTGHDPEAIAGGVVRLLEDRDLAARMAERTAPVARDHFAMDANIGRYLIAYRRALAGAATR